MNTSNHASYRADPEAAASAAKKLASELSDAFHITAGGPEGAEAARSLTIFHGMVRVEHPRTKQAFEIIDPIVASADRPASLLGQSWVVVQRRNEDGTADFYALNLREYNTRLTPVNIIDPYSVVKVVAGNLPDAGQIVL